MFRIINRTTGFIILPNKEIVNSQKSVLVDAIDSELKKMESSRIISIHKMEKRDCCWTKYCIDPLCVPKHDGSPDLVPLSKNNKRKWGALALSFKPNVNTELCFEIELPPSYVENSDLKPLLDWEISDYGNYGSVTWTIEFSALQNWVLFKKDTLTHSTPIPLKKGKTQLRLPKISGGGFKYNTLIQGRLTRMGSQDTYDLPVVVPAFNIHYQIEKRTNRWKAL